ncbi:DUF1800 domain-containing protein [Sphingomonas cannabina]|uniref:DUF1800 domain-containing protein n=1 Tax=Sphingomonas cannabina TaxID=2899123 RepID=UPI001F434558|nr:DUF1800 domain-containing protein [Sphingomonas cannabina]UIJ47006.1 DUF1800 domain-containing protein [Sphingomonas cannabina]
MTVAAIALNRFGLGAQPDDGVPDDPKAYLLAQFDRYDPRPPALAEAQTTAAVSSELAAYFDAQRQNRADRKAPPGAMMPAAGGTPPAMTASPPMQPAMTGQKPSAPTGAPLDPVMEARRLAQRQNRQVYIDSAGLRANAALATSAPMVERLVHFWANHFAVSADKLEVIGLAGPFEFEAIRPHVLGSFRDMLYAVERHPAMLIYLDQAQSIGPDSPFGARAAQRNPKRRPGLNENLAREIMELHTLGVRTGYTQADVTEFARAMTGWTTAGLGRGGGGGARNAGNPGDFVFVPQLHEPGVRTIMGKSYPQQGEAQAAAVLDDLAVHPATAKHVATKLVRHFVADDPPPAVVKRCEGAFLKSDGDLPTVYRALIDSPEAWAPQPAKFKTPWEWSISMMRALGMQQIGAQQIFGLQQQLGQPVWKPGQPSGWDDIAGSWAGPDAIMRRVEAAQRFAARAGQVIDARERAEQLFPGTLTPATRQAIARAESPQQAVALMLVAPEFMRR